MTIDNVELVFPEKPGLQSKVNMERRERNFTIRFTIKLSELEEVMKKSDKSDVKAVEAMLTVHYTYQDRERSKKKGKAEYPVLATTP